MTPLPISRERPRGVSRPDPRLLPAAVWSCFVIAASVFPIKFGHDSALRARLHGASHIIVFLATVLIFSVCTRASKLRLAHLGWIVVVAAATEWLETVVYRNHFEWADLALDLGGIAIGLLLLAGGKILLRSKTLLRERYWSGRAHPKLNRG